MNWKRFIPIMLIIATMLVVRVSGFSEYFTFENLKDNRQLLLDFVIQRPIQAVMVFIVIYAISTSLSLPLGALLSICGGFLFPQPLSTLYVVIGATIGAVGIFLAAKSALGSSLRERAGPWLAKMEEGFHENATSYMLFLRLVPAFPFWLVNLAPALLGVPLLVYTWTTFVGIIPGAFVFTQAGAGLSAIFDSGESFSFASVFNLKIKIALVALGLFALLPIVYKRWKKSQETI